MQGDDPRYDPAIATPKHMAVHSGPEPLRHGLNANVGPRDLAETDRPAFRRTEIEGKTASPRCAYNAIDGSPACASTPLPKDHSRGASGFTGFVTSDCGAIDNFVSGHETHRDYADAAAASISAGTDTGCDFRNELGPNPVPDYRTSVRDGGFYDWPYSCYGRHVDPRVRPQRPDPVARAIVPDYALSSHVAALGLTFCTGAALSARYRGGALIGEHGSWDRDELNGYKIVFVPFANARPNGKTQDFLSGFVSPEGKVRGRPVGVAVDRTGAVLVADDTGNTVWRVARHNRVAAR